MLLSNVVERMLLILMSIEQTKSAYRLPLLKSFKRMGISLLYAQVMSEYQLPLFYLNYVFISSCRLDYVLVVIHSLLLFISSYHHTIIHY